MTKRQAGIWEQKLQNMGFNAYRCDWDEDGWSVYCSETENGGDHFWGLSDVQEFLRWAERCGIA